jgi:hypothetical protein
LGRNCSEQTFRKTMATVCRISRNAIPFVEKDCEQY